MKKRKMNIAGKTGIAAALLLSVLSMETVGAAEIQQTGTAKPAIRQEAVWSLEAEGRADITWSVTGLHSYITKQAEAALEGGSEEIPQVESGSAYIQEMRDISGMSYAGEGCGNPTEMKYEKKRTAEPMVMKTVRVMNTAGTIPMELPVMETAEEIYAEQEAEIPAGTAGNTAEGEAQESVGETAAESEEEQIPEYPDETQEEPVKDSEKDVPSAYAEEETMEPVFYVVDYVSEYFEVVPDSLPENCTAEQITATGQNGAPVVLTKLVWQIALPCTDEVTGEFQINLKQAFLHPQREVTFPVSQDEPLKKDCAGAGLFLVEKQGEESRTVAQAPLCVLAAESEEPGMADIDLELKASAEKIHAGESLVYICRIKNTGEQDLADIQIESSFSDMNTKAVWEYEDQVQVNGTKAKITGLASGEEKTLRMTAVPDEGLETELTHTVALEAFSTESQEFFHREATETVQITPLKADFEVEKTADRTTAAPGDTVTYQICIRNTGEKTLHSVLSTERFLNANVQAQFLPKEGVTLNSTRTQALIPKIAPGEAFALLASVTIPPYFTERQLVNEVTVTSEETKERSVQAQSPLQVMPAYTEITTTPTLMPATSPAAYYYKNAGTTGTAFSPSSKPATGDRTEIFIPIVLLILSVLSGIKAYTSIKRDKYK